LTAVIFWTENMTARHFQLQNVNRKDFVATPQKNPTKIFVRDADRCGRRTFLDRVQDIAIQTPCDDMFVAECHQSDESYISRWSAVEQRLL
jgi:hypothetical protein